ELSLGYWRGRSDSHVNDSLIDLALIPALRFHPYGAEAQGPFVEGGIGVHLLSHTRIHDDRRFGSAFQFGDMVGVGWQFGAGGRYELGLRLHHVSNGGIKEPNQGLNFLQLRFVAPL
ncbi:MAG: acyloxyacyl hydrolase, partial [Pseudomonadota bacterium]|nr:acyloxyacyl hydrolase [Pseudomonadota bacterium]